MPSIEEKLEIEIKMLKYRLQNLEKAKVLVKDLKFREGDAAFHLTYGNVLITEIEFNRDGVIWSEPAEPYTIVFYKFITSQGLHLYAKPDDLIPITPMNRVLYGK